MKVTEVTAWYESLPKWVKILVQVIAGAIIGGVYRILKFVENKNTVTLVAGIIALIPPVDFVFWIIDIVTEAMYDRITILAD